MDSIVAIVKKDCYKYPRTSPFRPSKKYPESPFPDISNEENRVYSMVGDGLHIMGYDPMHYGTKEWNPLGGIISSGNTVVLKPNMVMDVNANKEGGTDCLYTQPSIVAAVLDYVIIALRGKGKIIVGDAPMQSCKFDKLVQDSGYEKLILFLKSKLKETDISISLVDFRELRSEENNGILYSTTEKNSYSGEGASIVDLGKESEFYGESSYLYENIRITNYDPAILKKHHNLDLNEYKVCKEILSADVIINIPKPKVHRKGGVTISLKNMVGISSRKEYLPHHTNGSKVEGGDEYLNRSWLKRLNGLIIDKRNYHMQTTKNYKTANFFSYLNRIVSVLVRLTGKDNYSEGSWYGNDTICRTLVDLNKILLYADKKGVLQSSIQRKIFIVADMIVSGEKEGPLAPSPKNVGIIAMGEDLVCFDEVIATLMGAKLEYIRSIIRARKAKGKFIITEKDSKAFILSNNEHYHHKYVDQLNDKDLLYFIPSTGWEIAYKKQD